MPSYPSFSLDTLRSLPVPNLADLDTEQLELLDGWFDWLAGDTLLPFPRMHEDPVRRQIDEAVTQTLGLNPVGAGARAVGNGPPVRGLNAGRGGRPAAGSVRRPSCHCHRGDEPSRRGLRVRRAHDRRDNARRVRAGTHHLRNVVEVDATDGDHRHSRPGLHLR